MTSPIDINPEHLEMVRDILHKNLPPGITVWIFGSRANWTTRDSSDLDLALEGDSILEHNTIVDLEIAFEESILPYRVDVVDLKQVNDNFRRMVKAQKMTFLMSKGSSARKRWHMAPLRDIIHLRISSVDKKTKEDEQLVRLCNYTDVYYNNFIYGDMDFMTATATEHEISKCLLSCGDVVITKDSEKYNDIGVPALVREDISNLVCGYHLAILRPTPKIDGTYLYYALSTRMAQHQFQSYANGVTRFGLRKADIGLVEIPLPPMDKQRAIANILRTLDDKIELNRRMNHTLEGMARTLFKSWFVDFDPVRAKIDGKWLPGDSLPGLPYDLYGLFPDNLVDSELGFIPEGWEVKALDEIANFQNGLALQKYRPHDNINRLPVVKIAQLRSGKANSGEWASDTITPRCIINDGDVIFSWSGSLMVKVWCGGLAALNQHLFRVTSTEYPKWFFLHWLILHLSVFQDIAADKATTMGHINRNHLSAAKCKVPCRDNLIMADRVFSPILLKQINNNVQSRTLAAQRDTLLPKLMSGDIRLGDYDIQTGAIT